MGGCGGGGRGYGPAPAGPQASFDSGTGSPPFRAGPSGGNDVVSPGGTIQVAHNLPAGTYALFCFVADDMTGIPHALLGCTRSSS